MKLNEICKRKKLITNLRFTTILDGCSDFMESTSKLLEINATSLEPLMIFYTVSYSLFILAMCIRISNPRDFVTCWPENKPFMKGINCLEVTIA